MLSVILGLDLIREREIGAGRSHRIAVQKSDAQMSSSGIAKRLEVLTSHRLLKESR
jgi:hypothetical protein